MKNSLVRMRSRWVGVFFILNVCGSSGFAAPCSTPVFFFDLGETIVAAEYVKEFDVFVNNRYTPGAHDYLKVLKENGAYLGLLVNYPESYGGGQPTVEARDQRKIRIIKQETTGPLPQTVTSLKAFRDFCVKRFGANAAKLCQTWTDPKDTLDWSVFVLPEFDKLPGLEAEGILVPDRDVQRKPGRYLFERAMAVGKSVQNQVAPGRKHCPIVYMGENAAEIKTATEVGLIAILLGEGSWPSDEGRGKFGFFYPLSGLGALLQTGKIQPPTGPKLLIP